MVQFSLSRNDPRGPQLLSCCRPCERPGGVGLNPDPGATTSSHIDIAGGIRAVENQATDRAYRNRQNQPGALQAVHHLSCSGERKIDRMIREKSPPAEDINRQRRGSGCGNSRHSRQLRIWFRPQRPTDAKGVKSSNRRSSAALNWPPDLSETRRSCWRCAGRELAEVGGNGDGTGAGCNQRATRRSPPAACENEYSQWIRAPIGAGVLLDTGRHKVSIGMP